MPEKVSVETRPNWMGRLKQFVVPAIIFLLALGVLFLIAGNWNTWASERPSQKTDDAYVRADVTPLSTKVAGLVATVDVSDYQSVKSGQLLVRLQDDDFLAQVQQAEAGVAAGQDSLVNNQRQGELQDARIAQAEEGIRAAEAEIAAAEAGVEAANASIANARSGIDATKADVKDQVAVSIERNYNKLERTRSLVEVANQVVKLRQEGERLAKNQLSQGVVQVADHRQSTAATYKAQADYLQASLGYLLAWAELEQAVGHTPGL